MNLIKLVSANIVCRLFVNLILTSLTRLFNKECSDSQVSRQPVYGLYFCIADNVKKVVATRCIEVLQVQYESPNGWMDGKIDTLSYLLDQLHDEFSIVAKNRANILYVSCQSS